MDKQTEVYQKEFLRILEIRSWHVIEALDDKTKTDEEKLQRIRGRLLYDTGHLNNLLMKIEEELRKKDILLEEKSLLENLSYRINEHTYFDTE